MAARSDRGNDASQACANEAAAIAGRAHHRALRHRQDAHDRVPGPGRAALQGARAEDQALRQVHRRQFARPPLLPPASTTLRVPARDPVPRTNGEGANCRAIWIALSLGRRPMRRSSEARSSPSTNSIEMKWRPSASAMSWTRQMLGWVTWRARTSSFLPPMSRLINVLAPPGPATGIRYLDALVADHAHALRGHLSYLPPDQERPR